MAQNATRRRGGEAAIAALAAGFTQAQAGNVAHVHRSTITRWLRDPGFRQQVDEVAAQQLHEARRVIAAASAAAARQLVAIATEPASASVLPVHTRLRAVMGLLELAERGHDNGLLEQRLAAVEAAIHGGSR